MEIIVREGSFDPERDIQPSGREVWRGVEDDLPAAVLNAMNDAFQPGSWYSLGEFAKILAPMRPLAGQLEVTSAVNADQFGVFERWSAAMEVGQSKAALMVCQSVLGHIERLAIDGSVWVRID